MIKDIARHHYTTFTADEKDVNDALRSMFFEDLEEIGEVYEIHKRKKKVEIKRSHQCRIPVYQFAKLHKLEFYYDFLDHYIDQKYFEKKIGLLLTSFLKEHQDYLNLNL